ncbi:hypothetical protein [Hymenopteran anphe-related virus OKIAV71]|uniref:Uncharacterized protein n=1 Tax=Hymenopteran anphe-related virus OKIAV71 TaxID=2792596 RepID=A0AAE7P2X6_9MONO|nr:hypothetical protein QKT02_gp2 [Hymenopteran anphe-related virus OKIAV71]QPL15377.1 hypothetical protein [Hymenopteran anphe-related virus OKIAV71]
MSTKSNKSRRSSQGGHESRPRGVSTILYDITNQRKFNHAPAEYVNLFYHLLRAGKTLEVGPIELDILLGFFPGCIDILRNRQREYNIFCMDTKYGQKDTSVVVKLAYMMSNIRLDDVEKSKWEEMFGSGRVDFPMEAYLLYHVSRYETSPLPEDAMINFVNLAHSGELPYEAENYDFSRIPSIILAHNPLTDAAATLSQDMAELRLEKQKLGNCPLQERGPINQEEFEDQNFTEESSMESSPIKLCRPTSIPRENPGPMTATATGSELRRVLLFLDYPCPLHLLTSLIKPNIVESLLQASICRREDLHDLISLSPHAAWEYVDKHIVRPHVFNIMMETDKGEVPNTLSMKERQIIEIVQGVLTQSQEKVGNSQGSENLAGAVGDVLRIVTGLQQQIISLGLAPPPVTHVRPTFVPPSISAQSTTVTDSVALGVEEYPIDDDY